MRKSVLGNIILVMISIVIALILSECIFRLILFSSRIKIFDSLRVPSYYVPNIKCKGEEFPTENYWVLNYLFNKDFNIKDPHPVLGWTGKFDRKTLKHFDQDKLNNKRPVLLYGDSFAMCIDSVKCFEEILNEDTAFSSGHFLLNFGVGGYGIDQIYLLFKETADRFENPFVIFSFLTTDMDRCMLYARDAQKPYFILTDNGLQLSGIPITLSSKKYFRQQRPKIKSYIWNKFKYSDIFPFERDSLVDDEYIEKIKTLNRIILEEAFRKLNERNIDYIVLIFHPEHRWRKDWRLTFLKMLCNKHNVPYICDMDVRDADSTFSEYNPFYYAVEGDGHPTSYMNTLLSKELKKYILDTGYRKTVLENYRKMWESVIMERAYGYREHIYNAPDWLENIKAKAVEKGIPLDSMVLLDAIYMARKDLEIE